ncbi:hypothetical protein CDAR_393191 [Caerostris darwini]|uniref:Uncharacterized protein n=1 Tax=Caerostris darwini TaxID=1538125 RepID=A0AAV4VB67_9ARAC|nr:hypothetical protein CDAR_393191 [Caerostris darwini]
MRWNPLRPDAQVIWRASHASQTNCQTVEVRTSANATDFEVMVIVEVYAKSLVLAIGCLLSISSLDKLYWCLLFDGMAVFMFIRDDQLKARIHVVHDSQ